MSRLLAIFGIAFLFVVVLTYVAERWHFFPEMGWGLPNSPGHYLDLVSAILAPHRRIRTVEGIANGIVHQACDESPS